MYSSAVKGPVIAALIGAVPESLKNLYLSNFSFNFFLHSNLGTSTFFDSFSLGLVKATTFLSFKDSLSASAKLCSIAFF